MNSRPAPNEAVPRQSGWASWLARFSMAALLFETITGLAITLTPFHPAIQYSVIIHTAVGALTLLPVAWYCLKHWLDYRHWAWSHVTVLGYVALLGLTVCSASGLVLMGEALFGVRTTALWRQTHLIATLVMLAGLVPHLWIVFAKARCNDAAPAARGYVWQSCGVAGLGLAITAALPALYSGVKYVNKFPEDYNYLYGTNRPFAPSLAKTDTGGAFDGKSLAGSHSCGTVGCHEQITKEWQPSAHRYAAMDQVFLGIQNVMAKQNGAESTRYCGGCHDPISLFSGTKNIFVENLTGLDGYQEGISCLACHAIRETDIKSNANYTVTQPRE